MICGKCSDYFGKEGCSQGAGLRRMLTFLTSSDSGQFSQFSMHIGRLDCCIFAVRPHSMNVHHPAPIETQRYYLRPLLPSDRDALFILDSDPEVHKFLGKQPLTRIEQVDTVLANIFHQYETTGWGRFAIIEKSTDAFIGWTGIKWETGLRESPYYDLGYRLIRAHWGKGIATETAAACLRYAFEVVRLESIGGVAEVEHHASNHILQKIGLRFVEPFEFQGTQCNYYELRREDWLNQP